MVQAQSACRSPVCLSSQYSVATILSSVRELIMTVAGRLTPVCGKDHTWQRNPGQCLTISGHHVTDVYHYIKIPSPRIRADARATATCMGHIIAISAGYTLCMMECLSAKLSKALLGPIHPPGGIERGKYRYLDGPCSSLWAAGAVDRCQRGWPDGSLQRRIAREMPDHRGMARRQSSGSPEEPRSYRRQANSLMNNAFIHWVP